MDFDVIIIGAGPGGYVAAIKAAQLGLKTAIVEKSDLGGVCLNWGCIPSKALLKSSEVLNYINKSKEFGINVDNITIDFKTMIQRSRDIASQLSKGINTLMNSNKIQVIKGYAQFKNAQELEVDGKIYKAKNYIIATGARPRLLPGITVGKRIWTSKEAMFPPQDMLNTMPKKILIMGSGAIGMEYASFYKQLGIDITVVELMDRILSQEDNEISALAQKAFEKEGVKFKLKCSVKTLKENDSCVEVIFDNNEKEEYDVVIIAIGVIANVENIGLENTKIKVEKNKIIINEYNQTGESHIFAIGDVVNPPWLAHKASHEGVMVAEKIKGINIKPLILERIPACTYCMPQISSIGITEAKAQEQKINIRVGRFPFMANGKALATGAKDGLIKVIFDAQTGRLLGAHMIGEGVTELISNFAIAMELETTEAELMHVIFPHPTLSEMIHEAVLNAYEKTLHLPKT